MAQGLLLLNLGTPDAPETGAVRRYLREFLSDPRVIDLAPWKRDLLLNLVILPFRPARSAEAYREVWTERGSPLLFHAHDLAEKLRGRLGAELSAVQSVRVAMRYQRPSIFEALKGFQAEGVDEILCFPLFPHYASSSWGSGVQELYAQAGRLLNVPSLSVVEPYYEHPAFVEAFAALTRPFLDGTEGEPPDKLLMSFHGLPERHVTQSDLSGRRCLQSANCCDAIVPATRFCYRAQCYATARALAASLELPAQGYEVAFQSRLTRDPWIQPFTDQRLLKLPSEGVKRLVVVVPSFAADCLETLEEIGIRADADFRAAGGEELRLVPSLNSSEVWVEGILSMLGERGWPRSEAGGRDPE